jgi:hypothetical protein
MIQHLVSSKSSQYSNAIGFNIVGVNAGTLPVTWLHYKIYQVTQRQSTNENNPRLKGVKNERSKFFEKVVKFYKHYYSKFNRSELLNGVTTTDQKIKVQLFETNSFICISRDYSK